MTPCVTRMMIGLEHFWTFGNYDCLAMFNHLGLFFVSCLYWVCLLSWLFMSLTVRYLTVVYVCSFGFLLVGVRLVS